VGAGKVEVRFSTLYRRKKKKDAVFQDRPGGERREKPAPLPTGGKVSGTRGRKGLALFPVKKKRFYYYARKRRKRGGKTRRPFLSHRGERKALSLPAPGGERNHLFGKGKRRVGSSPCVIVEEENARRVCLS